MLYAWLAKLVLLAHLLFVVFVVLGGLLVLRWPRMAWLHLPAAVWGSWVELSGRVCPLTPLENRFLLLAGEQGYSGGFLERYLMPLIYPGDLTRGHQVVLGLMALAINLVVYGWVLWRRRGVS